MQEHIAEKFQSIGFDDLKLHPDLLTGMLGKDQDVSLILEKRGNMVRYAYLRTYDTESRRILEEAKVEYRQKKNAGYSREQAFQDIEEAQEDIATQLVSQKQ